MLKYIVLFVICFNAFAEDFKNNKSFMRLEEFVSQIKTVQGSLTQKSGGEELKSQFYFKVPAKIRLNYTSKDMPIQMVITHSVVTYYDVKLDQKSQVKTPQNAVELLLTPKLSFLDKKISIKSFKEDGKNITLVLSHFDLPSTTVKAIFDEQTLAIKKIFLNTTQGKEIMEFEGLIFNKEIEDSKFSILTKKIDAKFDF